MSTSTITIAKTAAQRINKDAEAAFPNECCGFLYGHENNGRFVELAVPVKNSKEGDQRRRFEISPLEYMRAERYALANDTNLLGVYHSHPNHPAIASEHDLAKAMPYFSYVIVSVMDGKFDHTQSWKLYDDQRIFAEEVIHFE